MEKIKKFLNKMFNLNLWQTGICLILMIVLNVYIFVFNNYNKAFNYIAYLISAYSFIVVCTMVGRNIVILLNKIADKNKYIKMYRTDLHYNIQVKLFVSTVINITYVIFKFVLGVWYKSI